MKRSCTLCKASFILQDSLGIRKCGFGAGVLRENVGLLFKL